MEEIMKLAANYGFPMVVAGYLLIRLEPLIKKLQKYIAMLTLVVARQSDVDVDKLRQIVEGGQLMPAPGDKGGGVKIRF